MPRPSIQYALHHATSRPSDTSIMTAAPYPLVGLPTFLSTFRHKTFHRIRLVRNGAREASDYVARSWRRRGPFKAKIATIPALSSQMAWRLQQMIGTRHNTYKSYEQPMPDRRQSGQAPEETVSIPGRHRDVAPCRRPCSVAVLPTSSPRPRSKCTAFAQLLLVDPGPFVSAEEFHQRATQTNVGVSPATIDNTLKQLAEAKLLGDATVASSTVTVSITLLSQRQAAGHRHCPGHRYRPVRSWDQSNGQSPSRTTGWKEIWEPQRAPPPCPACLPGSTLRRPKPRRHAPVFC